MRDSAWRYTGVLAVGVVLGAVLLRFICGPLGGEQSVDASSSTQGEANHGLALRLHRLDDAIRKLSDSIEDQSNVPAQVIREVASNHSTLEPVGTTASSGNPGPTLRAGSDDAGWVEILPNTLARVLVVHGRTPFDAGVNQILPGAYAKYLEAGRSRDEQHDELKKFYDPRDTDTNSRRGREENHRLRKEWDRRRAEINDTWKKEIGAVAVAFEAELLKLALQKPGK